MNEDKAEWKDAYCVVLIEDKEKYPIMFFRDDIMGWSPIIDDLRTAKKHLKEAKKDKKYEGKEIYLYKVKYKVLKVNEFGERTFDIKYIEKIE